MEFIVFVTRGGCDSFIVNSFSYRRLTTIITFPFPKGNLIITYSLL